MLRLYGGNKPKGGKYPSAIVNNNSLTNRPFAERLQSRTHKRLMLTIPRSHHKIQQERELIKPIVRREKTALRARYRKQSSRCEEVDKERY